MSSILSNKKVTDDRIFAIGENHKSYLKTDAIKSTRKRKTTDILTDTPIKCRIEQEYLEKQQKKDCNDRKGIMKNVFLTNQTGNIIEKEREKANVEETESSSSEEEIELTDSDEIDSLKEVEIDDTANMKEESFVLVKFATKKSVKYYVGQIDKMNEKIIIHSYFLKLRT